MWQNTKIENYLKKVLDANYDNQEASYYYSLYTNAKRFLCDNIYSNIPGTEPGLTDHTEKHILNVLNMAWKLISDVDEKETSFNEIEVLLLCNSILFHDVGNIYGRKEHNTRVASIYNSSRSNQLTTCLQERHVLLKIVSAHCGTSKNGSKDTLIDLPEVNHLFDKEIRMRELAAVLRFADELAEGPQRTSPYMIEHEMIQQDSIIFHKYAEITDVHLDKGNNRVVLTYNIDYPVQEISFEELLTFVYKRILKMDFERRYCKYYAPILRRILRTEASINFTVNGDLCDLDLPIISLSDKFSFVEEDDDINLIISDKPELSIQTIENNLIKVLSTK
jgi:hypothetical protein